METLNEYERQKQADLIAWRLFPAAIGFWFWFGGTIFFWQRRAANLDTAASLALGIGAGVWLVTWVVQAILGRRIIHTVLWEGYGCGCIVALIAVPQIPYIGILILAIWGYFRGDLALAPGVLVVFVGWANMFLLQYLHTPSDAAAEALP